MDYTDLKTRLAVCIEAAGWEGTRDDQTLRDVSDAIESLQAKVAELEKQLAAATSLVPPDYAPTYDEAEFRRMVNLGTIAWKDAPDNYVEDLRGPAPLVK